MTETRLYIDNTLVDIDPKTDVALTLHVNDIAELKDRQSSLSNQFKCLLTDNNKALFGYANKVQSLAEVVYAKINCRLSHDGTTYIGYLVLDKVTDAFYTTFYGGNAELFKNLEGLKLIDMDLSAYDIYWTKADMVAIYGSLTSPTFIIVDDGNVADTGRSIDVRNQYPSMYIKDIFQKIITDAGFTYSGSLFSDTKFSKMTLPFTNNTLNHSQSYIDKFSFFVEVEAASWVCGGSPNDIANIGFSNDSTGGYYDNNNQITLGSYVIGVGAPSAYLYSLDGYEMQFVLNLNITISGSSVGDVLIFISGVGITTWTNTPGDGTYDILIEDTAVINIGIYVTVTIIGLSGITITINSGTFRGTPTEIGSLTFGNYWDMAGSMPDITQKEFIKSIMQMTAATVDTDGINKNARFELFNTITDNKPNAPDIDEFIDFKAIIQSEHHASEYGQLNYMRYAEDDSVTKYLGDSYFEINDNVLTPTKELFKLPFAASVQVTKLHDLLMWEVLRVSSGSIKPRILLWGDLLVAGTTYGSITLTDGSTTTIEAIYYYGYFNNSDNSRNLDFESLINDYYSGIINMLTAYRKVTLSTIYTPNFINTLDYFTPLFSTYFNSYFYMNKISNHKKTKASSTQLIRL